MPETNRFRYFAAGMSLILYITLSYRIERHETVPLFACYFSLFAMYALVIRRHERLDEATQKFWMIASLVFRAALLFSIPNLSDDFYRFIWDGRLLAAGEHPFTAIPSWYMTHPQHIPGINASLYARLGATETFTIYPPVAQLIFWLCVKLSPDSIYGSVVLMKMVIFSFEVATLRVLRNALRAFRQPASRLLLYALNPLVILELTGNLHFEGIMIFFLLLAVCLLRSGPAWFSPALYALSICTKLIPLLFLPLLMRYLGWKNSIRYWVLTAGFTALFFLPLLSAEIIYGLSTSLRYYFQQFEFNASVYYLVRAVGYKTAGFNIIQYAGPALALAATSLILYISFRKPDPASLQNRDALTGNRPDVTLFTKMLWCLLIYFLSVTILHPWYIITLLVISLLTPYRFTVVWTGAIFLTYAGYTASGFQENLWLVALEYVVVIGYLIYETAWTKHSNSY